MSGDNLNPDVSAFVPKSSPKNEDANAVEPPTAQKHSSEAINPATNSTEDANLWKEVKRRSKTSQQKETRPPSTGSDIMDTTSNVTVNNVNSTAVNSNSVASNATAKKVVTNAESSGTKKSAQSEKEELDFQFDEEIHYDEDMLHSGGRHNNFSEFSDDEESDFELSDRDINKLLIVTQVKSRPPKHEGMR